MRRLIVATVLLLPSLAVAQQGAVEITPMVGLRRGGEIIVEDRAFQNRNVNVDLATEGSFGVRLGVGLSSRLQLEIMADRQNGRMKDNKGLFGEQPGGFVPILSTEILDFKVTYYHLGVLWHFKPAPNGWYVVISAGDTQIEPKSPLQSVDRFSASLGAGVKVELDEHSSLRFEARYFRTNTGNLPGAVQQFDHRDCYQGGPCTYTYRYSDTLEQGQLSVGYVIRF
ncbi:MAG: porin family protein [Acidobacteriia bacterium]|nr:porin family protein [Terriglobia bacterium]